MEKVNGYTIETEIGKGSYGRVYLATSPLNEKVAIKKIFVRAVNKKLLSLIENEIKTLDSISDPSVLKLICHFQIAQYIYIVTEYCAGGDLQTFISQNRSVPQCIARKWLGALIQALSALREKKIVHRDLKIANLLLTDPDPEVAGIKLCDFGFAKFLASSLTSTQLGTPMYMAPEIFSCDSYSYKVDIWSLGVVAYEMLCGHLPFLCLKIEELKKLQKEPVRFPEELDESAKELIRAMLAYDPHERPDYQELLNMKFFIEENKGGFHHDAALEEIKGEEGNKNSESISNQEQKVEKVDVEFIESRENEERLKENEDKIIKEAIVKENEEENKEVIKINEEDAKEIRKIDPAGESDDHISQKELKDLHEDQEIANEPNKKIQELHKIIEVNPIINPAVILPKCLNLLSIENPKKNNLSRNAVSINSQFPYLIPERSYTTSNVPNQSVLENPSCSRTMASLERETKVIFIQNEHKLKQIEIAKSLLSGYIEKKELQYCIYTFALLNYEVIMCPIAELVSKYGNNNNVIYKTLNKQYMKVQKNWLKTQEESKEVIGYFSTLSKGQLDFLMQECLLDEVYCLIDLDKKNLIRAKVLLEIGYVLYPENEIMLEALVDLNLKLA